MREDKEALQSKNNEDILNHSSRVDLNNLMRRVKEEEKKNKRNNVAISAAAVSAIAVFGIIMTL